MHIVAALFIEGIDLNAAFPGGAVRGPLSLAPYSQAQYFPVVGRVDGLNNTRFVADVRVVNRSSQPEFVTLEFFSSNPAGLSAASAARGVLLAPGAEQASWVEIALELAGC